MTGFNDKVTRKHIENKFRKIGDVDDIEYPVPGRCLVAQIVMTRFFVGRDSLTGFITYKTHKEARLALKLLNNQVLKGIILLG